MFIEPVARPDGPIVRDVKQLLESTLPVDRIRLRVTCSAGVVRLEGDVRSFAASVVAEGLAAEVLGVRRVENRLTVSHDSKRPDAELKTEATELLARDVYLSGLPVAVKVERGVLRIEGTVGSPFEKERAGERLLNVSAIRGVENHLTVNPTLSPGVRRQNSVLNDADLTHSVNAELHADPRIGLEDVTFRVADHEVTLRGTVSTQYQRDLAEIDVRNVVGVVLVNNELKVVPAPRPDADVRKDILHALASNAALHDQGVRATVENGVVTLEGQVYDWYDHADALQIARRTRGVRAVHDKLQVTLERHHTDDQLVKQIRSRLRMNYLTGNISDDVTITVKAGIVTLSGTVHSHAQRRFAANVAFHTDGVWQVNDNLWIAGETDPLSRLGKSLILAPNQKPLRFERCF